jgi:Secretion system C-terminal sorting domain
MFGLDRWDCNIVAVNDFINDTGSTYTFLMYAYQTGLLYDNSMRYWVIDPDGIVAYKSGYHELNVPAQQAVINSELAQLAGEPLIITVTPESPMVTVPASGGSFDFGVLIENDIPSQMIGNFWVDVTLPAGNTITVQEVSLTVNPGVPIEFPNLTQDVPGGAPPGLYTYAVKGGVYPDFVAAEDSFTFQKALFGQASGNDEWSTPFGITSSSDDLTTSAPFEFELADVYPNPFNPTATVSLTLPDASVLTLTVHDVLGREVVSLADGSFSAGHHSFTLNGESLSSGVYFVRANATGFGTATQKVVLMK